MEQTNKSKDPSEEKLIKEAPVFVDSLGDLRIVHDGTGKHYEYDVEPCLRLNPGDSQRYIAVFVCAMVLRALLAPHSYSGEAKPPMYGDFEAQRHWQEIAVNLDPADWYRNSSLNDLNYWGMDYPPLSGYHSMLMGWIAYRFVDESYVELEDSRGITDERHKVFMRLTVLAADALLYLPAIFAIVFTIYRQIWMFRATDHAFKVLHLVVLALYPGQILIDNGHFQYNNVSLGLFVWAVRCTLKAHFVQASFWFSLALNYKQMELYHALPIFVYMLAKTFKGNIPM